MTLRIFKTEVFLKSSKKMGIPDKTLLRIADEISGGNRGDKIGECLYKKRIPRTGGGKSGGYRTLVTYQEGERLLFIFVYERKDANKKKEVLEKDDIKALALYGIGILRMTDKEIAENLKKGFLEEVLK